MSLPEFEQPPLIEVVMGVQFDVPGGYRVIRAGEIRELFKSEFPGVEEYPPLAPAFETFGPGQQISQFQFMSPTSNPRFWFLSGTGEEIIQFQNDRLIHNWRKLPGEESKYPRFSSLIDRFESELRKLSNAFNEMHPEPFNIRQCELSYINHIRAEPNQDLKLMDWLNFVRFDGSQPDDMNFSFRKVINGGDGRPLGRLFCDGSLGSESSGEKLIVFNLTVRGAPRAPSTSIEQNLAFLDMAHQTIVSTFTGVTTDSAHVRWGRSR